MALDFPDSPVVGELYGGAGATWRWNGSLWESTAGAGGTRGVVAFAQVTVNQTGISGSGADLAGLSVTFNGVAGRRYKVTGHVYLSAPAAEGATTGISIRDGAGTQINSCVMQSGSPGLPFKAHCEQLYVATATGPQTFKIAAVLWGGTGPVTMECGPQHPSWISVEDVTLEQGVPSSPDAGVRAAAYAILTGYVWSPGWVQAMFASSKTSDATLISPGSGGFTVAKAGWYQINLTEAYNVATLTAGGAYTFAYVKTDKPSSTIMFEILGGLNQQYGSLVGSGVWFLEAGAQVWVENYCTTPNTVTLRPAGGYLSIAKVA